MTSEFWEVREADWAAETEQAEWEAFEADLAAGDPWA